MYTTPRFLQGIFGFEGRGLDKPMPIDESLRYVVPVGVTAQVLYFRGGNGSDVMVTVVLMRNGLPMRYFPIGAQGSTHVPLRVVEDLDGDTVIELYAVAPQGIAGTLVIDFGLVEV